MPRRAKKVAGSWMTPVSSCFTGQPGPHPAPPPSLPTTSVNPYLPPPTAPPTMGGSCYIGQPGPHPAPPPSLPTTSVNSYLPPPTMGGMTPLGPSGPANIPSAMPSPPQPINVPPTMAPHPSPNNNTGQPFQGIGGVIDPLSQVIMFANTNPYIIGCFMLLLNLGGRFLSLELTKKQEEFLAAPWLRPALFFTVIFIATRNLAAAFWVSLLFFSVIWVIANEHSPYCLIPSWCGHDIEKEKKTYEENAKKCSSVNAETKASKAPTEPPKPNIPKE